ncbi:MAG: tetratricopeptide repeat protein [Burkholderiales bacterium]|nr:tetratricopeptide repeat protein [Burkholderiales bacterium]
MSGPATTRPTPRARSAASQAKLSDLPQMLVTAPPGASKLELAYAALTQGRLADAASSYKEVLKVNPEERDALLGLAYVSHKEGRDEEARDYYKRVLRQEPGNPTARAGLLIQNLTNDAEDVSASSRDVAEQHPSSAAAQSVLGHSLVRQGRLADAQMAFQRAQVLEPSVALHAFNLAVALDRLKSHAMARTFYERALSLSRQSGGEQVSGLPHAVVQQRIDELRLATSSNQSAAK